MGQGASEPLELVEGFVPLCHAACVTLSEELATVPCPLAGAASRSPRALDARGVGSQPDPWLELAIELRIRQRLPSIRILELG
jgi:hypothetical protein